MLSIILTVMFSIVKNIFKLYTQAKSSRQLQNNQALTHSRLPPELERLIFEYAAREYRPP